MGNGKATRERFINNGKMWGVHRDVSGYYPVKELRHADSDGLPTNSSNLKIVHLPYRVGADKVERVFGVKAIDRMGIEECVKGYQLAANLDDAFQKAKPFLFFIEDISNESDTILEDLEKLVA